MRGLGIRDFGLLALLWTVGLFLRIPVLAAPPLAGEIAADLGLSTAQTGALTTLPVVVLALAAPLAAWVIARIGVGRTIAIGLVIGSAFSVTRGWTSSAGAILAASVGMGLGIALFQTALPSAVRSWVPARAALGSAVYLNGMMVGEFAGAGLTLPIILPLANGDWRTALLLWALPAVLVAALVLLPKDRGEPAAPGPWAPDWRSAQTWELGLWLAASIAVFFSINAYMETSLKAHGQAAMLGTLLLAYNIMPLLASFVVVWRGDQWIGRRGPVVLTGLAAAIGTTGFALIPGWLGFASALVAGFAATVQLILVLSLPPVVARGTEVARLTGGITFIGYSVAFVLPLAGGLFVEWTGSTALLFSPMVVFAAVLLIMLPRTGAYDADGDKGQHPVPQS
jgi:CP family cyanate transporter-like MFS transporter